MTSHLLRHEYHYMDKSTRVGVIDKAVTILEALSRQPLGLAELVAVTGLPRPTAHRLAQSLEQHALLERDPRGRYHLGLRLQQWVPTTDPLIAEARAAVRALVAETGESAQVYVRRGDERLCLASAEPASGLRDMVPTGTLLPLTAGSGAQVLLAWEDTAERARFTSHGQVTETALAAVRKRGWAHSIGQREPGVASISAPVHDSHGVVIAALSLSGPAERLRSPSPTLVSALVRATTGMSTATTPGMSIDMN